MYVPSFKGCWAKIERAQEQREALDVYIRETFAVETNRPCVGIKFDSNTSEHVLYVNYVPPNIDAFLDRVAVRLGEIIHNLRSALDHMTFQLALRHTNNNVVRERAVQFPIADTIDLWDEAKKRYLREIDPTDIAIIERFQAYHRIDENVSVGMYFHPLAMLRDLADTDKHRLLPVVMIPSTGLQDAHLDAVFFMTFGFFQQVMSGRGIKVEPVKLGTEIARMKLADATSQTDMDMAGYVLPQVALAEGRSVIAVVDKIAAVTIKVIREFDPSV